GAQFAQGVEYARRVEQAGVQLAAVDMQAAPGLADDRRRGGDGRVAVFDRLRPVDAAAHRLVLDAGLHEAPAHRREAVARVEGLRADLRVEGDVGPATFARQPQQRVEHGVADARAAPVAQDGHAADAGRFAFGLRWD